MPCFRQVFFKLAKVSQHFRSVFVATQAIPATHSNGVRSSSLISGNSGLGEFMATF
jgi:hypothetical protein